MISIRISVKVAAGVHMIWRALVVALFLSSMLASLPPVDTAAAPMLGPDEAPHFAAPPFISLNMPAEVSIGQDVSFSVGFDNNDPAQEPGYGPIIDVILPTTGADGDGDGLYTSVGSGPPTPLLTANYMGIPFVLNDTMYVNTFNSACQATHPFFRDNTGSYITVSCPAGVFPGDNLVSLRLPFGSFTFEQPAATVNMTVNMSDYANLGAALTIRARGGYEFGYTPLDDWCCGDAAWPSAVNPSFTSDSVTPTLFTLSKSYSGPENEAVSGPNFRTYYPMQYTVSVAIAPGQSMTGLTLNDLLPDNLQYYDLISSAPAGATCTEPVNPPPPPESPGSILNCNWPGAVSGTASMTFDFYIPLDDASSTRVIPDAYGDDRTSCDDASITAGIWTPLDGDDLGVDLLTTPYDPVVCDHTLNDQSIALQKGETTVIDVPPAGSGTSADPYVNSPGDTLEYTLTFQISDYFAFNNLVVTDVVSDGQRVDATFPITIEIAGNPFNLSPAAAMGPAFPNPNWTYDIACDYSGGLGLECTTNNSGGSNSGTTTLTFRVSQEIINRVLESGGRMLGGCVNPLPGAGRVTPCDPANLGDGPTWATITYRTVIQDVFTDSHLLSTNSGDASVDQGDVLDNAATVIGDVLDVADLVTTVDTEDDRSSAGLSITTGSLVKELYAVNGAAPGSPPEVKPGDEVTYRIKYTMPTGDEENLRLADFLPLPVFFVDDPDANDYDTLPPAGSHNDGDPDWVTSPYNFDTTLSTGIGDVPPAGQAKFGPNDTFYAYTVATLGSPGLIPAITTNATSNSLTFTYGDFDGPSEGEYVVDILFTVTVSQEPFADRLYLTNQANAYEGSTNAGEVSADAIVQIILTEPVLTSTKGVVWTSNPDNVFNPAVTSPAGVVFQPPGVAPRWTGTITSGPPGGLQANPIDSNVQDVDALDIVTFAITIENSGTSLKGAFDITLQDVLQPQYQLPAGGLNLQVYYGNGSGPIPYRAVDGSCTVDPGSNNNPCGLALFQQGIELIDPVGVGVCSAHNPNLGNNVIIITYDLQIRSSVSPGDIINTETLIRYAGEEGGPNHVPVPSPLSDQASVTVSGAPVKFFFSTSETHTSDAGTGTTGDPQLVAVGEVIRYRIAARIPESSSTNFQVVDVLPPGLIYLDDASAQIAFISDTVISSTAIDAVPAIPNACNLADIWHVPPTVTTPAAPLPCVLDDLNIGSDSSTTADPDAYGNETDIYFKLGNLVNIDQDNNGEFVVIDFNVLVHNQTTGQNDSGDNRDNVVRAFAGSPLVQVGSDSAVLRARIVEPFFTLDKSHVVIGTTVDANDSVTYTVTFTNDSTAPTSSTADAFDIRFLDSLPAPYLNNVTGITVTLDSIDITGSVINNSAGNTIDITIPTIPLDSVAVITYSATIDISVTPGQAINNTGDLTWTSLPGTKGTGSATPGIPGSGTGERTGLIPVVQPNDHVASYTDTLNIDDPFFSKSLDSSSAPHTADPSLAIGEVATFGLYVTLPEGTTPTLSIVDDLPVGLEFVTGSEQVVTQASPPASCGTLTDDFAGTLPTMNTAAIGGSGENITFDFGPPDLVVTEDNNPNNNTFLVCFEAIVLNEAGNQQSPPPVINSATMTVDINGIPTDFTDTANIDIVESVLQINKSVDDLTPGSGQVVTFTLLVDHDGTTAAESFDVLIWDDLPADLSLDVGSVQIINNGVVGITNNSAGNRVEVFVNSFPTTGDITITYEATVTSPLGTTINNIGNVTWTSLTGDRTVHPQERNGDDGVGGALDDYAAESPVVLVANRNLTKALIADNHAVTVSPDVTIGEILTFQVTLRIPGGSTDLAILTDTLDDGLAFVSCSQITAGANITSSTIDFTNPANCNHGTAVTDNPVISNSGRVITLDLGNITNSAAVPQNIVFTYDVVVLDILSNIRSVLLDNDVEWTWSTGRLNTQVTPSLRILEPDLGLEKSVDTTIAVPGSNITYTLRVFHNVGVLQTNAYDLLITDLIPTHLAYVPGSLVNVSGVPGVLDDTNIDPVTGQGPLYVRWDSLLTGQESTIQFTATVSTSGFRQIQNVARLEWTSLPSTAGLPVQWPGQPPGVQSQYNLASTERRYDPLNPADFYGVTARVIISTPVLPDTGFAPGQITTLPEQPIEHAYQDLGDLWLEIPSLGVRIPIIGIPAIDREWDLTWLAEKAGYLEGTAFPTWVGNSAITAHVYTPDGLPGPFVDLDNLSYGDQVIVHAFGQRYIYEVRTNQIVSPQSYTLRHEDYSWLTLITCQGYSEANDSYRYRILVRAIQVKIESE
jgi:LPXTG-site transpeptidase (sortase) family protein